MRTLGKIRLKSGEYLVTQGRRVVEILIAESATQALLLFANHYPSGSATGDYQLWAQIDTLESEV